MKRICLGLMTQDEAYGQRLLAYIRESSCRVIFAPVWYTEAEQGLNRLAQEPGPRVLLMDEDFPAAQTVQEWSSRMDCPLFLLTDGPAVHQPGAVPLAKYQPLNHLLDLVLEAAGHQEIQLGSAAGNGRRSFILSVYSAVGGAGKTMFTYIAARLLMRMGYRPLVLSLEAVPSLCWRMLPGEDAFGRALFQTGKSVSLPVPIDRFCTSGQQGRMMVLPAAENRDELEEMGGEMTAALIAAAAASPWADVILIDLDSSLHPRVLSSMRHSDKVVCLVPDELLAMDKTRYVLEQLERQAPGLREGFSLLLTKCNGVPSKSALMERDAEDALPFQREWQRLESLEAGLEQPLLYHERLYGWLVRMMNQAGIAPREAAGT